MARANRPMGGTDDHDAIHLDRLRLLGHLPQRSGKARFHALRVCHPEDTARRIRPDFRKSSSGLTKVSGNAGPFAPRTGLTSRFFAHSRMSLLREIVVQRNLRPGPEQQEISPLF